MKKIRDTRPSILAALLHNGYYVGLLLIMTLLGDSYSRYYSIPFRVILLIWMSQIIIQRRGVSRPIYLRKEVWLMLFFFAIYTLKIILTILRGLPLRMASYDYVFMMFSFCLLPYMFFGLLVTKNDVKQIAKAIFFSGVIFLFFLLKFYGINTLLNVGRINMATQKDINSIISPISVSYVGSLTVYSGLFIITQMRRIRILTVLIYVLGTAFSVLLLIAGNTRSAFLGLAVAGTILLSKQRPLQSLVSFGTILVIVSAKSHLFSHVMSRFSDTIQSGEYGRNDWQRAFDEFYSYPLIGGAIEKGMYPHNIFLEILMSTGLIGFVLFISSVIVTLWKTKIHKSGDMSTIYCIGLLLIGVVQGLFSGAIYFAVLVFMPLGILVGLKNG